MIADLIQTRTNFNMSWEILCGGSKIAEAEAPFLPNMFLSEIRLSGAVRKLIFDPNDMSFGKSLTDRLTFRVYDRDHVIGSIVGRTHMVKKFFGSYPYYEYMAHHFQD